MDSNFYYFGYLTHSEFPEVAIGLICFAAAFFIICKTVILVKEWRQSHITPVDSPKITIEDQTSANANPDRYKDIRETIEGYWRDEEKKLLVHIYSWGDTYLMEISNPGISDFVRYFTFSPSISDEFRFFAEGEEELVFAYNEQFDILFYANTSSFMRRVSENEIKMEKSIREALDKSYKETLLDDVIFEKNE